jgi:hypothetical protein
MKAGEVMKNINEQIKLMNNCLPPHALRRNSLYYNYVCYMNNIYCLLISGLYDEVGLFVSRAYKYREKNKDRIDFKEQYMIKSENFLESIQRYIEVDIEISKKKY